MNQENHLAIVNIILVFNPESMWKFKLLFVLSFSCLVIYAIGQNVPIQNYAVNNQGQVLLEIEAQSDQYYMLTARHEPNSSYESITSMTMGIDGVMEISEVLSAYPLQNYKITAFPINDPGDVDGDGIDDVTEFNDMPTFSPLNFARELDFNDGTSAITTEDVFSELAVVSPDIPWAPFLNDQAFAKFAIVNQNSDEPEVYFINSKTHEIHADFLMEINVDQFGDDVVTGEIVYNPNEFLPNGVLGQYSFNYSFGDAFSFDVTNRTFELLAANMPFLRNNFVHFIGDIGEDNYQNLYKDSYIGSRINVILESQFFADVDYLPFNQAEGFGFFREMQLDENPNSRDIVLYNALPNSLPRVGGVITSVVQTPLSHVNLRAIQDNVPNAFIRDPLMIDSISNLIGKYIYYKVDQESYEIREASLDEVNAWYEKIRPTQAQIPERDLSFTEILPLDEIEFEMSTAFGAKCSNVATMRRFGFPEGTIPDGFGVPFYFYDEFMKFNDFYTQAEEMITDPEFISDLETRIDRLKDFRKTIKDADMPQWMLDALQEMHDSFPEGTAVRCRSSTNNEDLPGFSGAGLYTSKTQHLDEGHISKSIKQVYASMWNFRAYDEREFYRVDQYIAAMGVLCHPNYQEEKSNGVGVSIDPVYNTENTFYLNTQVGESLVTNPEANTIPEEILLDQNPDEGYIVLRRSNLVTGDELVMGEEYLDLMREYLGVIHDEFEILYDVVGAEGYGMDIEYKVTSEDQLIIKQARPWVSFWADIKANFDLAVTEIIEPVSSASLSNAELITARVSNVGLKEMTDFDISLFVEDQLIETKTISDQLRPQSFRDYQFSMPQDFSAIGEYKVGVVVSESSDGFRLNDTLVTVVHQLHLLEGSIAAEIENINCGLNVDVLAKVNNAGATVLNATEIEVVVNGLAVDTILYDFGIPTFTEIEIQLNITENLQPDNNEITFNILNLNGEQDAIATDNSSTINLVLDSDFSFVTLLVNPDEYPEENSWVIVNSNNQPVAEGDLPLGDDEYREEICIKSDDCYSLLFFDSYGDGICCDFGEGSILILNEESDTLAMNDGQFVDEIELEFCSGDGLISVEEIELTHIKLFPNPTSGEFVIELNKEAQDIGALKVGVYNSLGQEVISDNIDAAAKSKTISLIDLPEGNYFVKCYNDKIEEHYKVIKI